MTTQDHWRLINPQHARMIEQQARTDFSYRVAAWSGGAFRLHQKAADKWWPRTARP